MGLPSAYRMMRSLGKPVALRLGASCWRTLEQSFFPNLRWRTSRFSAREASCGAGRIVFSSGL